MNSTEHLLACLGEECGELQQAVGKALRFGSNDFWVEKDMTNAQQAGKELCDIVAVAELLQERGIIPRMTRVEIEHKKARVLVLMDYARNQGSLT